MRRWSVDADYGRQVDHARAALEGEGRARDRIEGAEARVTTHVTRREGEGVELGSTDSESRP